VGAGHAHALYVHEHSPVHGLAPEAKLVATFVFVVSVALTPREAVWAFAAYAAMLGIVLAMSRVRLRFVIVRLAAVTPFVLFALIIPFVAGGDKVDVVGVAVSRDGLWGAWNVVAKATLGAATSIILAATTEIPEMLRGMTVLRVPAPLTAIAMFMVRYLVVVSNELGRMRTAMTARGYDPRWLWQARPIAASAGALFIRSYERGERVHAAMVSRGYTGTMPEIRRRRATPREWALALALPVCSLAVLAAAVVAV